MNQKEFLKLLKRRLAQVSVSPSALRNQGAPGIIKISRDYLEAIDICAFRAALASDNYLNYLDEETEKLLNKFPENAKSWGAARKSLNLFFREVVYNFYFANHLNIPSTTEENNQLLRQLEVPLDKDVATSLIAIYEDLPKWTSIKELTLDQSKLFQEKAAECAAKLETIRVHLDLKFWREKR